MGCGVWGVGVGVGFGGVGCGCVYRDVALRRRDKDLNSALGLIR